MIYLMHGVVSQWCRERISHSLLIPDHQFALHLQHRPAKYVPLTQALAGKGDALTIDDATRAGLRAALFAKHFGHAVTWFINGSHVDLATPYFPFQISCMLDTVQLETCRFQGKRWDLRTENARRILRLYLKEQYMQMSSTKEIEDLLQAFSCCLRVGPDCMEQALFTVTLADLRRAADAGITLQNHGWTHRNPNMLDARKQAEEVERNEEYLGHIRRAETRIYAPPFGRHISNRTLDVDFTLLADRKLTSHHGRGRVVNRNDLRLGDSPALVEAMNRVAGLPPAA